MRLPERLAMLMLPALLAACASRALTMAPDAADQPWRPALAPDGTIEPGAQGSAASGDGYVLPSNPVMAQLPDPAAGLESGHLYTLPELIDLAQSLNPATRQAWEGARIAALAAGIKRSSYLPKLSASIVGGYQTTHTNDTTLGVDSSDDVDAHGTVSALSLQWLLFDFGQREHLLAGAKQGSVVANVAFTASHQRVIYEVCLAFYADAAAQARAKSAADGLNNAEDVRAAAEARHTHGIGTIVELAQARQHAAAARLQKVQADSAAQDARLSLLAAVGLSPLAEIQLADVSRRQLTPADELPVEQLASAALARRPDVLGAYAAREASLADLKAAQAEFLPKLFLSATGAYTTSDLEVSSLPAIGDQSPTVNLSGRHLGGTVLLGITVPLFDGGTRKALVEQARAHADRSDAALASVRTEAIREVIKARNAVTTSIAACEAATELAAAARITYDAALAAYRNDVGDIIAVTDAQSALLKADDARTDAYSMALSAAATLAMSIGTLGAPPT